jgi:hypothetical protein
VLDPRGFSINVRLGFLAAIIQSTTIRMGIGSIEITISPAEP